MEVLVHIEISKNSCIKYEYDKTNKIFICDRFLHTPHLYPFNYGYVVNTLAGDGDPLDVVLITKHTLIPNCYIKCQ